MRASLRCIDHRAAEMAVRIHAVQGAAYRQEAALLGAGRFPPLDRTVQDIAASTDTYFGAFDDEELLGVISVERRGASGATISSLTVAPPVQGRGVGGALLAFAAESTASERLWVATGMKNLPALALYRRFGFAARRRRRVGAEGFEIVELTASRSDILSNAARWLEQRRRATAVEPRRSAEMAASVQTAVALRPATEGDLPFLLRLRHETMDRSIRASGAAISEEEHLRRVRARFECAQIILVQGKPAGLLKLARDRNEWRLIQIQITPDHQDSGIGSRLLEQIVAEARTAGASLALDVLKVNPARRLYERLGFVVVGESAHSFDMQLRQQPSAVFDGALVRR